MMKGKILKLKNGLKFMVLDIQEYEGEKYLFLASVTEEIQYIFARVIDEINIEPITDGELILKLTALVGDKLLKDEKK